MCFAGCDCTSWTRKNYGCSKKSWMSYGTSDSSNCDCWMCCLVYMDQHARKAANFQWRQSQWSAAQLLSFGCRELQAVKAKHLFTDLPVQSGMLANSCLPAVRFDSSLNYSAYNTSIDLAGILGAFVHTKLQVWLGTTGQPELIPPSGWG